MHDLIIQNKPKNLRTGCHFYNQKMEFDVYNGEASNDNTIRYLIPLNKNILEPLGFETVYDDYTSEMYFQRDIEGYRVRTIPPDFVIGTPKNFRQRVFQWVCAVS